MRRYLQTITAVVGAAAVAGAVLADATITDLGTLGGSSFAYSVNATGHVVGAAQDASGRQYACVFQGGGPVVLPDLPGASSAAAYDINDMGEAVGNSGDHAALWSGGSVTDLGLLGFYSQANSVNNLGEAVGWSLTATFNQHACAFSGGAVTDLGTLPGTFDSVAYGVNDNGQVVGASGSRAVLWEKGTVTDLGDLGGGFAVATGINNAGKVCGYSYTAAGALRVFVWQAGAGMTALPTPAGDCVAMGINAAGHVAGYVSLPDFSIRACLWTTDGPADLGVLPAGGSTLANALNDAGQIAGYASLPTGVNRAVLFTVPTSSADTTPPTTHVTFSGDLGASGWYAGPVQVALTAEDNAGGVGVASTQFRLDGGAVQTYSAPFMVAGDGAHTVEFWSTDAAGNAEAPHSEALKIDGSGPELSVTADLRCIEPPNGKMVPVRFFGKVTDGGSGIAPGSARFVVSDEYGQVQPSGAISLQPDGRFCFTVHLEARRDGSDSNGRLYLVKVSVEDRAGHAASRVVEIWVGHDSRG